MQTTKTRLSLFSSSCTHSLTPHRATSQGCNCLLHWSLSKPQCAPSLLCFFRPRFEGFLFRVKAFALIISLLQSHLECAVVVFERWRSFVYEVWPDSLHKNLGCHEQTQSNSKQGHQERVRRGRDGEKEGGKESEGEG